MIRTSMAGYAEACLDIPAISQWVLPPGSGELLLFRNTAKSKQL
jgi:hypothetical protein